MGGRGTVDAALLRRVSERDEQAFADLYNATSRVVFGIVLRVLRNRAQAEEVAQEVYLEVWRTAVRFDVARGTASAWLNMIAHRRAVDWVRSQERRTVRDRRYTDADGGTDLPDASVAVVALDEAARVRRALGELSETQRRALVLAYFDGHSQREVAEILGVPLGTVKTRTRDALRRLRGIFEAETAVDDPLA